MSKTEQKILNMKTSKEVKRAVNAAAIDAGFDNTSQFMLAIIKKNPYVKKALEKYSKIN